MLRAMGRSAVMAALLLFAGSAHAQLITGLGGPAGFGDNQLDREDDVVSAAIPLDAPFAPDVRGVNYYGTFYTDLFISSNGLVSFGRSLTDFFPGPLAEQSTPFIAAYWADADLVSDAPAAENAVYWHTEPGRIVVTWYEVRPFDRQPSPSNTFQLVLYADPRGGGDFEVEFIWETLDWGTADSHVETFAEAGFSAGDGSRSRGFSGTGSSEITALVLESPILIQVRDGIPSECGDDILEGNEECEDGNDTSGDGCNALCEIEAELGEECGLDIECRSQHCVGDIAQGIATCCIGPCGACESCSEDGEACQPQPSGVECRFGQRSSGIGCDPPELCDGVSPECPPDVFLDEGDFCSDPDLCVTEGVCTADRTCEVLVECPVGPCIESSVCIPEVGCEVVTIPDCDAGPPDAGPLDAGPAGDAGPGGLDAGVPAFDGGPPPRGTPAGGGLTCAASPGGSPGLLLPFLLLLPLLHRRRR
jgi:MYXO-CTERM domain-containing protein